MEIRYVVDGHPLLFEGVFSIGPFFDFEMSGAVVLHCLRNDVFAREGLLLGRRSEVAQLR
jgi:hypothetical protein